MIAKAAYSWTGGYICLHLEYLRRHEGYTYPPGVFPTIQNHVNRYQKISNLRVNSLGVTLETINHLPVSLLCREHKEAFLRRVALLKDLCGGTLTLNPEMQKVYDRILKDGL